MDPNLKQELQQEPPLTKLILMVFYYFGIIWRNFIGYPSADTSRFTGLIRTVIAMYFIITVDFGANYNWWQMAVIVFLFYQLIIGFFFQFMLGIGSKMRLENGFGPISTSSTSSEGGGINYRYPQIAEWFRLREHVLRGKPGSEASKFFIETGALTEASIEELEKYPQTRDALDRLNHDLKRPPADMIRFMLGKDKPR
jgi:hypothetical protein